MVRMLLILYALQVGFASAASFDCQLNLTIVESAICDDENLRQLDSQLSSVYSKLRVLYNAEESNTLLGEQRVWLRNRNSSCLESKNKEKCLKIRYESRLAELERRFISLKSANDERILAELNNKPIKNEYYSRLVDLIRGTKDIDLRWVSKLDNRWNKDQCRSAFNSIVSGENVKVLEPKIYSDSYQEEAVNDYFMASKIDDFSQSYLSHDPNVYFPSSSIELYFGDSVLDGLTYLYSQELISGTADKVHEGMYLIYSPGLVRLSGIKPGQGFSSGLINAEYFNPALMVNYKNQLILVNLDLIRKEGSDLVHISLWKSYDGNVTPTLACKFRNY